MEHLLYDCDHHSVIIWAEVGKVMTQLLADRVGHQIARIEYTPKEIIFNVPHPSIQLYEEDALVKKIIILYIQELKRDIIYRKMNLTENHRNREVPLFRIQAHIMTTMNKIISLLEYQENIQTKKPKEIMVRMKTILENMVE